MNPWNGLLESLHSSFIDEVVEIHPEPKPVLGMPVRLGVVAPPRTGILEITAYSVKMGTGEGLALFALDSACEKELKTDALTLSKAVLKRAAPELARRGLTPAFGEAFRLGSDKWSKGAWPKELPWATRTVWIPLEVGPGHGFLGVAI